MDARQYILPVANLVSGIEQRAFLQIAEMGEAPVRGFLAQLATAHSDDAVKAEAQSQLDAMNAQ